MSSLPHHPPPGDFGEPSSRLTVQLWSADADYPVLAEWMENRNEEIPPRDFLPWSGFVAELDGEPIAMCFVLSYAHAPLGVIELMVSRPGLDLKSSRGAMRHLWEFATIAAKNDMGLAGVVAHTWSPGMEREARNAGFTISRRGGSLLWKRL